MTARKDIDRLRNELEDLFNEVWRAPRFSARRCFRPAVDCFRTVDPAQLVVVVELPGIDPETVHVIASDRSLQVSGERRRPRARTGGQVYQQMEIDYGPFERRIALTDDVETQNGTASYEQGLLKIVFPIMARPAPHGRVPIIVKRLA
ncbi:MAG: Hsp20/alpha crystallin family protein [Actinobacteria bacterium]|nr:Hsp20/alpha crystallin family protein [Actinomycetota bacterium]